MGNAEPVHRELSARKILGQMKQVGRYSSIRKPMTLNFQTDFMNSFILDNRTNLSLFINIKASCRN